MRKSEKYHEFNSSTDLQNRYQFVMGNGTTMKQLESELLIIVPINLEEF